MKKIIFLSIILVSGFYFNEVLAVDFVDSSGYTPSWTYNDEYHTVLVKCIQVSEDLSRDANWCLEWMAYVLDQGVENFPQSTKDNHLTNTQNISQRVCIEDKICVVTGDYLKYRTWDTENNSSDIAVVEFKEKINDNTIRVFIDGFGSKPLTYNLNLKTGIQTHNEYSGVYSPINLLEPIPMKIGQQVFQGVAEYYQAILESEKTINLKELGLPINIERVVMATSADLGSGDIGIYAYDKETGVLITHIEKFQWEGKEHSSGTVLIDTNMFSISSIIIPQTITNTSESNIEESPFITPKTIHPESQQTRQEKEMIISSINDERGVNSRVEDSKSSDENSRVEDSKSSDENSRVEDSKSSDENSRVEDSKSSDEVNSSSIAFVLFIIFGLTAIVVGVMVWIIKKRRQKSK